MDESKRLASTMASKNTGKSQPLSECAIIQFEPSSDFTSGVQQAIRDYNAAFSDLSVCGDSGGYSGAFLGCVEHLIALYLAVMGTGDNRIDRAFCERYSAAYNSAVQTLRQCFVERICPFWEDIGELEIDLKKLEQHAQHMMANEVRNNIERLPDIAPPVPLVGSNSLQPILDEKASTGAYSTGLKVAQGVCYAVSFGALAGGATMGFFCIKTAVALGTGTMAASAGKVAEAVGHGVGTITALTVSGVALKRGRTRGQEAAAVAIVAANGAEPAQLKA